MGSNQLMFLSLINVSPLSLSASLSLKTYPRVRINKLKKEAWVYVYRNQGARVCVYRNQGAGENGHSEFPVSIRKGRIKRDVFFILSA